MSSKASDNSLYNDSAADFVPVACHYDAHTLLTKNGELLQTIQIHGLLSEKISKNLFNLREVVRNSISSTIECSKYAFWIHTVREKADLDDPAEYPNFFSANVHDIWRRKNYWHDKFVNKLYITIVHKGTELKLKNLNSFINSFFQRRISSSEEESLEQACGELHKTVDSILSGLSEYGAEKLGTLIEGEECYSQPISFYKHIMHLSNKDSTMPTQDISSVLASHQYVAQSDRMEVIGGGEQKQVAIISIKEYQEISSDALDKFMQTPVEMIATEIFYFVKRSDVVADFTVQNDTLNISGDSELRKWKGLDKIVDAEDNGIRFCHQQISFMVIGEDKETLDRDAIRASESLAQIGIVHIREDINLEKLFWSQLPANFSFLSRMKPTILDNTAALASLHNFPMGNQYNPWGRATTLLRTEKGTPYFMNFHDQTGKGSTCIFGNRKSGRTTLLNFLLSEMDKYRPSIMYITDDMDSGLYIKAKEGRWFQREKNIINPLICEDTPENRVFMLEFFKIISKHYFDPLTNAEMLLLTTLSETVFTLPGQERSLAELLKSLKESDKGGKTLKKRLAAYAENGIYHGVFEREEAINIEEGEIVAMNLQNFDDAAYSKAHYPKEKRLIEQFEYDLNAMRAVKAGIVLAAQNIMKVIGDKPKIFVMDNLAEIINLKHYSFLMSTLMNNMHAMNGIFVSTVNTDKLYSLYGTKLTQNANSKTSQDWIRELNTSFFLPSELSVAGLEEILDLDSAELRKLARLTPASRMFLIRQDGTTITSELSIGGLIGLTSLLCSGEQERELYREIIKNEGNDTTEKWVQALCEACEN
ncbi:MAG: transporter [Rickettsiales bacterium]|nr:MAG: transporter [Rickettsiales bacterium]